MPSEIQAFFRAYRDAFNALDGQAVARLYAEPSGIAQDGKCTHWATEQAVTENMVKLCQLYESKGFLRAEFAPGQFINQGENHAVADLRWRIEWSAGQEPWQFQTTYNLLRTQEGWRVLLCTAYTESALVNAASAA